MSFRRLSIILGLMFIFVPLSGFIGGWLTSRHPSIKSPSLEEGDFMMSVMVGALHGQKMGAVPSNINLDKSFNGPLFVSVISKGKMLFRCQEPASPLIKSVKLCSKKLAEVSGSFPSDSRIRIDLFLSKVKIFRVKFLEKLFVLPGIEAIAGEGEQGKLVYLLPSELFLNNLMASGGKPLKFVRELNLGIDLDKVRKVLANESGSPISTLYRVKLFSLVNSIEEPGKAKVVLRENEKNGLKVTRKNIYDAALRGGDYMLRSLIESKSKRYPCKGFGCRKGFFRTDKGQFLYMYHLMDGTFDYQSRGFYNLPRHAGTTYALANLYRLTGLKRFGVGASKAIAYMVKVASKRCSGPNFRCISNGSVADLGSSALTLLAVAEYRLATNNKTYDKFGKDLAEFLLYMQRDDGSFKHSYFVSEKKPNDKDLQLYYSGEASLALAKSYRAWKDKRYIKAAEKGLDDLVGKQAKPLPFRFAFGEEHWTCQAAREVWPEVQKSKYLDFCINFAKYIKRQQWDPGESAFEDFIGGYGFSVFLPPHANGSGSRTESNVSVWELANFHHRDNGFIKEQIKLAVYHILHHQRRPETCWLCHDPVYALGAVPSNPIELDVRIDTVQHTTTGLIRAWASVLK